MAYLLQSIVAAVELFSDPCNDKLISHSGFTLCFGSDYFTENFQVKENKTKM